MNTTEISKLARSIAASTSAWSAALVLGGLALSSCIVEHTRCGEHEVSSGNELHACVCAPGYVNSPLGYGCDPCGSHEVAKGDKCDCESGYARATPDSACEMIEGSLAGDSCSADAPCSAPNPYCAIEEDEPYCTTTDCTKNDDCTTNWRCDHSGAEAYCQKPPAGLQKACQSTADCADTEATFCDTFVTHSCLVRDCAAKPSDCPSQWRCCDLTPFIGTSICVELSSLDADGNCLDGNKPVTQ